MPKPIRPLSFSFAAAILATAWSPLTAVDAVDPFADEVVSFEQGRGGGFNGDLLPDIILGPPAGAGLTEGSTDVLSLGHGGQVTLALTGTVICDGPGADFIVFENAFHAGSPTGPIFVEAGIVAVSQDGETFLTFPYDPLTFVGLAGRSPVLSHPDNAIDPTDPTVAGGDAFDLAQVGLSSAAYVRITDGGDEIVDPGNMLPGGTVSGFDLDAVAAVHACNPGSVVPGDLDESGTVDEADLALLIAELFDGDGDRLLPLLTKEGVGGRFFSHPHPRRPPPDPLLGKEGEPDSADVNNDGRISAADITDLILHVSP